MNKELKYLRKCKRCHKLFKTIFKKGKLCLKCDGNKSKEYLNLQDKKTKGGDTNGI